MLAAVRAAPLARNAKAASRITPGSASSPPATTRAPPSHALPADFDAMHPPPTEVTFRSSVGIVHRQSAVDDDEDEDEDEDVATSRSAVVEFDRNCR